MKKYVITIARGFGTGGKVIAGQLAESLGIPCYENRILTYASQLSGEDESKFREVDEKLRGSYLSALLRKIPKMITPKPMEGHFVSDDKLFEYQKQIIEELADTESCIIVGKCADAILRDRENVVSFYIEAPRQYCVKRIMERMQVNEEEANKLIAKTDAYRADYYRYYTGGEEWTNPTHYDFVINSEKVGHDNCVKFMKYYIEEKFREM